MATTAKIAKEKTGRRSSRCAMRNRCRRCGRPRGYLRKFALCRLCFRQLALDGRRPGRDQEQLVGWRRGPVRPRRRPGARRQLSEETAEL